MKNYYIVISQNGWEYTGWAKVKCKEIKKIGDRTILADGVEIEFDEEIKEPTCEDD